ncbi:MAG: alpha/beta fold hydrolase, partial [Amphiplicatus sp.]
LLVAGCGQAERGGVTEEEIEYETQDHLSFYGTLRLPTRDKPVPLLLVYHAATGGRSDFAFYDHLKTDLPKAGVATFIFDRRGTGDQPGDFNSATFEELARDGLAALSVLKADPRIDATRIGTWGISQGGWIAPLAATLSNDVSFVISVSGPGVTPAQQMAFAAEYSLRGAGFSEETILQASALRARIDAYYRNSSERDALQADIASVENEPWYAFAYLPTADELPEDPAQTKWRVEMDYDPAKTLTKLDAPMLVMFGRKERWVPVEQSTDRIRAAVSDQNLLTIYISENSGHFMSGGAETEEYMGDGPVEAEYLEFMLQWIAARE